MQGEHATDVLKSVTTETRNTLLCCWTQPGTTAAAAMFVINPETTVVDAVSTTLLAESPFIRIASFRLPSRNRDNRFGMTLSSTATTTMSSAEPGFTELNPARSILPVRSDRARSDADLRSRGGRRVVQLDGHRLRPLRHVETHHHEGGDTGWDGQDRRFVVHA